VAPAPGSDLVAPLLGFHAASQSTIEAAGRAAGRAGAPGAAALPGGHAPHVVSPRGISIGASRGPAAAAAKPAAAAAKKD